VHAEAGSHLNPNTVIAAAFQAAGLPSPAGSTREGSWEVDPRGIIDRCVEGGPDNEMRPHLIWTALLGPDARHL
jgi:hypothetical protein